MMRSRLATLATNGWGIVFTLFFFGTFCCLLAATMRSYDARDVPPADGVASDDAVLRDAGVRDQFLAFEGSPARVAATVDASYDDDADDPAARTAMQAYRECFGDDWRSLVCRITTAAVATEVWALTYEWARGHLTPRDLRSREACLAALRARLPEIRRAIAANEGRIARRVGHALIDEAMRAMKSSR